MSIPCRQPRQRVPALMTSARIDALAGVGEARAASGAEYNTVIDRSAAAARATRQALDARLQRVAECAEGSVEQARSNAQALMREVAGQGLDKTLERGFAIVRTAEGNPVTSSEQAQQSHALGIQFRDGSTDVRPASTQGKHTP